METINSKLFKRISLFFTALMLPLISFAVTSADITAEAEAAKKMGMYMEIACGVVFVGGVVAFLIWKSKQDKKVREKQIEQMKKIQAARRRAA